MNSRTNTLMTTYKPELTVTVYKSADDYYLESHTINEAGQVMEGKPLLQETLQAIIGVFFDERKNMAQLGGLLPDNLLSFTLLPGGNYKLVWCRPAEIRVMHFATALKLPTTKVWVPAMVYCVDRSSLEVFALKTNTRPTEKTKLLRAPFYNVNDDGDVCLGNANVKKPKDRSYSALIKYWEDLFWLSEFTHVNGDGAVKTDINKVWKKLLASKTKIKWSDLDELLPTKLTLKNIL